VKKIIPVIKVEPISQLNNRLAGCYTAEDACEIIFRQILVSFEQEG
jgi:hypothetical protein